MIDAIVDCRDADLAHLRDQLATARMEFDQRGRTLAEVIRERQMLIAIVKAAVDVLRGMDCKEVADWIEQDAKHATEAYK